LDPATSPPSYCALKITQATATAVVGTNKPPVSEFTGGPYAIFDSASKSIDVSGRIELLGIVNQIVVKVTKDQCAVSLPSTRVLRRAAQPQLCLRFIRSVAGMSRGLRLVPWK
jgi:hypothetical protein